MDKSNINFWIYKDIIIESVENKFSEIKTNIISMYPDTPDKYLNYYILISELDNNKLEPDFAYDIAQIIYLNNTEFYTSMIQDFYQDNIDIFNILSQIINKKEAMNIIAQLLLIIKDWIDLYIHKKSKYYEDISWIVNNKSKIA